MRSFSDIPNRYTHILLQEAGAVYDQARGLPPIRRLALRSGSSDSASTYNTHVETALGYFDGRCAYCGAARLDEDHLIPRNRASCGLHAWGNVVPACRPCNSAKSNKLWTDHLTALRAAGILTAAESTQRATAIRAMVSHFDYRPRVSELLPVIEDLYRHADVQARSLIRFAVSALKPYLDEIAQPPA
jgi:5-methylcytosine-specific restriction endonuclease McrA